MKAKFSTLFVIFAAVLFLSCSICARATASLPPIFISKKKISNDGRSVVAKGCWKATAGENFYPKVNIASIICDKNLMVCTETVAGIRSTEEDEFLKTANTNMLTMNTIPFEIIDWTDDDVIIARRNAPVANMEIKISTKDNFAERSSRETVARGVDSASSENYYHWILE